MTLTGEFITELMNRKLINSVGIAPRLLACVGSHVLNLRQMGFELGYDKNLQIPAYGRNPMFQPIYNSTEETSMRAHLLIVGEPGTGKSIWGKQCFGERVGLIRDAVQAHFTGRVTEAGLVGQKVVQSDRTTIWRRGLFDTHVNSILFFSEFANINAAMKARHSNNLDNTMLDALESGEVITNIGDVNDHYITRTTIMGGVQPRRFEQITGFDRRIMVFRNPPPVGDMREKYIRAQIEHAKAPLNKEAMLSMREAFRQRFKTANEITSVRLSQDLEEWLVKNTTHEMSILFAKAAIGYYFIERESFNSEMVVPASDSIRLLLHELNVYHGQVTVSQDVAEIVRDNELPFTALVTTLIKERVMPSRRKAEKAIADVVNYFSNQGYRFLRLQPPNAGASWVKVPTGLPLEYFIKGGYKVFSGDDVEDD